MSASSKWKEMLEEFRALGGVADNVELRKGSLGPGLFPIDPKLPTKIVAPQNLLFKVKDVEFKRNKIRIKDDSKVPERERAFFESYEKDFSWGAGGKMDCEAFFESVGTLPENVRNVLVQDLSLAGLKEMKSGPDRTQRRFLRSRMITYKGGHVIMPVVDLANHGVKGCPFGIKEGITIGGTFEDEVLAHYGMVDPYGAFDVWGFTSNEPVAFSLPATMKLASRQLSILRQLSNKKVRGKFRIPVLESESE